MFDIPADGKTDEQLAEAGLAAMSDWMDQIGVVRHASELGLTKENVPHRGQGHDHPGRRLPQARD